MKKNILVVLSTVALFILAVGAFLGYKKVEVFGHRFNIISEEITFSGEEISDVDSLLDNLEELFVLKKVNLGTYPVYLHEESRFAERYPEVEFVYTPCISLYGKPVPVITESINIEDYDFTNIEELNAAIPFLPSLKEVSFGEKTIPAENRDFLVKKYPSVNFNVVATYDICNLSVREDITKLNLTGTLIDSSITESLSQLKNLEVVDFTNCNIELSLKSELAKTYPDILFIWNVELGGDTYPSLTTESLDLTYRKDIPYEDLKTAIPLLGNLTYVDAGYSSFTNEELGALREENPDVAIEWVVHMGQWSLRTDAIAFSVLIRDYEHTRLRSKDIEVLKYCTKLQALDLGHQWISDLSVIGEYLPELRILILADNAITDLSPLANLKHLHYLEFFVNQVTDMSPLAQCRELVDLNISYNRRLSDITPILDLPLLERLWLESTAVSKADLQLLYDTYPDTKIIRNGEGSVDQGWRTHPRYWAMIKMFYNNYMDKEFSKYDGLTERLTENN